jgi:hypothetical protein
MSTAPANRHNRVTLGFAGAAVVGMFTVVVPLLAYLGYRSIFGAFPEAKLYALCAFGSAAAAALLAGRGWRGPGVVCGLVGGFCGTAAFLYAAGFSPQAHDPWAPKAWLLLVFGAGAHAGLALFWLLERLKRQGKQ